LIKFDPPLAPTLPMIVKELETVTLCVTETEQAVNWQLISALAIWNAPEATIV
jgi:hypothetical protein